jgi:hypothetical protein
MTNDRRSEPRTVIDIPVELDGQVGFTRDVSANGIYFIAEQPPRGGPLFSFTLLFDRGGPMVTRVPCLGRIIRIDLDELGRAIGIAATIESFGAETGDVMAATSGDTLVASVEH